MNFLEHISINPKLSFSKGKSYPFIEMANVSTSSREPSAIDVKEFSSGVKFQDGDSVVARIEPCLQNGKRFYCKNIGNGFGSTEFLVFRPKDETVDNVFLHYFLQTDFIRKSMIGSMTGATGRQRVNNDIFKTLEIDIPPIETQKHIANILSAYDDLIENNQKQIKLLEEMAQRLYKEWFVDLRFPNYENTAIVDGVPEGWNVKKLADISDVIMGQSPKSEFYNQDQRGLPFHQGVGSYGRRFVGDETYSTSFTRIAEANSILFSVRAPVGRMNYTKNKIVIGRGLSAITHKDGMQSYLFYMLKEKFFKDNIVGNGSIFASITKNELLRQTFLVPNLDLDKKYNDISSDIDKKIEILDSELNLLQQARDRLLPKLMSGELEV